VKLTERVYLVGSGLMGLSLTDPFDCHVYLLDGGEELALIDAGAGLGQEQILRLVQEDGLDPARVAHIILTHQHADHAGGAAGLRAATGGRVYLSAQSAHYLREGDEEGISLAIAKRAGFYPPDYRYGACPVDVELREGDTIAIGDLQLQAIETPGHCDGHLSFQMRAGGRTYLFAGDAIFHNGQILLQNIPDCHIGKYAASIQKLRGRAIDVLLPGHLSPVLARGQVHIDMAGDTFERILIPRNAM
jgi:glyoxylase-like metal-dependent hydrolase (beta-lactamase superfamily II)